MGLADLLLDKKKLPDVNKDKIAFLPSKKALVANAIYLEGLRLR
jgi:hypothetical protein